ncbi:hypothetical protein MU582_16960 [Nocardioidaceae bacterium SCSIO 66511]|nr:hypothetical protein MU582_16960 [Nocardioidaceae bacterium SCSIO 66511]
MNDVPSPLLTIDQVVHLLEGALGDIGAWGGGVGGALGGGLAGRAGGTSGGRIGARFGTRHLTKLDGEQRTLQVPRTEQNVRVVRDKFFEGRAQERTGNPAGGEPGPIEMVGVVGSGTARMNPCVIQLVWFDQQVHVTAHAREGLIKQRTCSKALRALTESLESAR